MEKVRELMKNPLYTAIAAGVLGLLVGWMLFGWVIFPVTYTDTDPSSLRQDFKQDYARMAVDSYTKNSDAPLAKKRYDALGPNASAVLDALKASGAAVPAEVDRFRFAVTGILQTPSGTALPGGTPAAGQPTSVPSGGGTTGGGSSTLLLVVLCVVMLVIGGAIAYLLLFRGKKMPAIPNPFKPAKAAPAAKPVERPAMEAEGTETPIAQFMTTYKLGVDLYDDSFSIDSPTGEFLGECGVGISETIGVGDPKKVTAFEVWLFDKNDIQTVTKVLMSEHAYNDPTIFQKLASKGEPVLVEAGKTVLLETATLQLEARVVDIGYGTGALPGSSYFDRMTLELAIWPKPKEQ